MTNFTADIDDCVLYAGALAPAQVMGARREETNRAISNRRSLVSRSVSSSFPDRPKGGSISMSRRLHSGHSLMPALTRSTRAQNAADSGVSVFLSSIAVASRGDL
ncbi:MAG: hypothetical protein IPI48_12655 [bacterium]|nr:hypothetical protein [bacterium]